MTEEIGHGFLPGVPRQRVWFYSDQTQQNFKDHRSTSDHVLRLGFCFIPLVCVYYNISNNKSKTYFDRNLLFLRKFTKTLTESSAKRLLIESS
jgi:hypothetical protein